MSRWFQREIDALEQMKLLVKEARESYPPYPEVVGERRLIRFLRGLGYNPDRAAKGYLKFLKWRKDNNIDRIRNDILYGGKNHPNLFPNAEIILRVLPQIVIAPNATDYQGQPITLEIYSFDPDYVIQNITVEQYIQFLLYSLEFRTIIVEQLSEQKEKEYLDSHPNVEDRTEGYGVVVKLCCIRDLNGLGLKHLGPKARSIVLTALSIVIPNYQEYLGKSYIVNMPWIFGTLWMFVKTLLDEYTLKKIALFDSNFLDGLLADMPLESVPVTLGGSLPIDTWGFDFDINPGGLFDPKDIDLSSFHLSPPAATMAVSDHPTDQTLPYLNNSDNIKLNYSQFSNMSISVTKSSNIETISINQPSLGFSEIETVTKPHLPSFARSTEPYTASAQIRISQNIAGKTTDYTIVERVDYDTSTYRGTDPIISNVDRNSKMVTAEISTDEVINSSTTIRPTSYDKHVTQKGHIKDEEVIEQSQSTLESESKHRTHHKKKTESADKPISIDIHIYFTSPMLAMSSVLILALAYYQYNVFALCLLVPLLLYIVFILSG